MSALLPHITVLIALASAYSDQADECDPDDLKFRAHLLAHARAHNKAASFLMEQVKGQLTAANERDPVMAAAMEIMTKRGRR